MDVALPLEPCTLHWKLLKWIPGRGGGSSRWVVCVCVFVCVCVCVCVCVVSKHLWWQLPVTLKLFEWIPGH